MIVARKVKEQDQLGSPATLTRFPKPALRQPSASRLYRPPGLPEVAAIELLHRRPPIPYPAPMAGTAPTRYRYDVFLSHSSADKPVVRELAERLKAAGLRVWFDDWLIQPGDLISAKLEEGLEHSAVLLLCMSANAFGSDWVSLEGHTAIFRDPQNLERRFVPLRLDDAPIKAMLRGYAYIDWQSEAVRQAHLGRLLQACGAEAGERPGEPGPATAGAPAAGAAWEPPPRGPAAQPRQAAGFGPVPAEPPSPTECPPM